MQPYYQHGGITIYHGDCREVLPSLAPVDAVVTDPPWNMGFFKDDSKGWPEYSEWLGSIKGECEKMADGQCWFLSTKSICYVAHHFEGYKPFASCKNFSQMSKGALPNCWDIAFIKGRYTGNGRNWFVCNTAGMLQHRTAHPTPRTLDVMSYVMGLFDWPSIIDPFMGSGTTLRAAKDLGRKAIGIEISERYCEIAANRLSQEVLQFN